MAGSESLVRRQLRALQELSLHPDELSCEDAAARLSWTMRQLAADDEFWNFDSTASTAGPEGRVALQHRYLNALTAVDFSALLVAGGYQGEPQPDVAACLLFESISDATKLTGDPAKLRHQLREMAELLRNDLVLMARDFDVLSFRGQLDDTSLALLRHRLGVAWGLLNKIRIVKILFLAAAGALVNTASPWLVAEVPTDALNLLLVALGTAVLAKFRGEVIAAWRASGTEPTPAAQRLKATVAEVLQSELLLRPHSFDGTQVASLRIESMIPARANDIWPSEDPTESLRTAAVKAGAQLATAYSTVAFTNREMLQTLDDAVLAVIGLRLALTDLSDAFDNRDRQACFAALERSRAEQDSIRKAMSPLNRDDTRRVTPTPFRRPRTPSVSRTPNTGLTRHIPPPSHHLQRGRGHGLSM